MKPEKKSANPPEGMGWGVGTWLPTYFSFYNEYYKEICVFLCRIGDTSLQVCRSFKRLMKGTQAKGSSE